MMGSTRCPACGQAIGSGSSFCPACGAQLSSMPAYGSPGILSRMVPQFSGNGYTIGQKIAKIKGNVWEHDYHIQDTSGQPIAQIHKKWVSVRDSYNVEILNPAMDPYLVLSYAISLDNTEKREKR